MQLSINILTKIVGGYSCLDSNLFHIQITFKIALLIICNIAQKHMQSQGTNKQKQWVRCFIFIKYGHRKCRNLCFVLVIV